MKLVDLVTPEHVLAALRVSDKRGVLAELSRRAASAVGLDQATILAALEAREQLGSTGLGRGFALPHARLPRLAAIFCLFAQLRRPIEFEAIDGQPVDLVMLMLIPDQATDSNMALAAVAKPMREVQFARQLREAGSAAELYRALAVS